VGTLPLNYGGRWLEGLGKLKKKNPPHPGFERATFRLLKTEIRMCKILQKILLVLHFRTTKEMKILKKKNLKV
jgi:hypothetical protein